jgi:hypothetical protein
MGQVLINGVSMYVTYWGEKKTRQVVYVYLRRVRIVVSLAILRWSYHTYNPLESYFLLLLTNVGMLQKVITIIRVLCYIFEAILYAFTLILHVLICHM